MKKQNEKILKYKELQIEVSRMWKVEVKTTPVIVGHWERLKKTGGKRWR